MQEKIREIAARVRDLREVCQISAADMASHLDLPLSVYQGYEEGRRTSPPAFCVRSPPASRSI